MSKRYIDANKAKHEFNIGFGGVSHAVIANQIIDSIPTADVVPRETVEQIFTEIEKALNAFDGSWADTVIDTQCLIEELKKKYIGE